VTSKRQQYPNKAAERTICVRGEEGSKEHQRQGSSLDLAGK